jgi:cytoskeletal protein RodZ
MALTGHLSDLSLSELIEFFCNQRKSGRLKVLYPKGAGYFYLQAGSVVDARIGALRGIDAVYYALTLPNAQFEFSADAEAANRTINQPWTQVVLEGLRRLDENIAPGTAFPPEYVSEPDELESAPVETSSTTLVEKSFAPAFLSFGKESVSRRKPLFIGAIVVAVLASVAVIGVPAGWYRSRKAEAAPAEAVNQPPAPQSTQAGTAPQPQASTPEAHPAAEDPAAAALRRQREKERKAREARTENPDSAAAAPSSETLKPGAKRVVVTVTYDESGRVTQASGGDANALRIARQKRFPPGKAGSATISIPIN